MRAIDRRSLLLGGAALLAGCAPRSETAVPVGPAPAPTTGGAVQPTPQSAPQTAAAPSRPVPAEGSVAFPLIVDTANRLTASSAATLAALGVQTVFRYYDHEPSSIRDKRLEPAERDAIFGAGLSIGAVFQHYNNCHLTFSNSWGREDAARALEQAAAIGQPAGSAIYFGVDGDWPYRALLTDVIRYFEDIARGFEGSGYLLGVYGGGCVCETLRTRGLAQFFWLSGSTGFTGTQGFYNSGRWTMYQNALDIRAGGSVGIDTNLANPVTEGFVGQFGPSGPVSHGAEATRERFAARRFIGRPTALLDRPAADGRTLDSLRKHLNVAILGPSQGGYLPARSYEGGVGAARGQDGWIAESDLVTLDGFEGGVAGFGVCGSDRAAPASVVTANCAKAGFRRR